MQPEGKIAILLGATGLTGSLLLDLLLEDDDYAKVRVFGRNPVNRKHPKLQQELADLLNPAFFDRSLEADVMFCCVGTTRARTPDKKRYRAIDYGIPVRAAQCCKSNGIPCLIVMSALGARKKSRIFYNRIKGEMEEAVLAVEVPKTHIVQPSLLQGRRKERRVGEWIARQLMKIMNLVMVGPLDKYRAIEPETVAAAMVCLAGQEYPEKRVRSDKLRILGEKYL